VHYHTSFHFQLFEHFEPIFTYVVDASGERNVTLWSTKENRISFLKHNASIEAALVGKKVLFGIK